MSRVRELAEQVASLRDSDDQPPDEETQKVYDLVLALDRVSCFLSA